MTTHRGRSVRGAIREGALALALLLAVAASGAAQQGEDAAEHVAQGTRLMAEGKPADALAAFDRALSLDSQNADAHSGRGTALLALRRPTEALAATDRALELRPDHGLTHARRAACLDGLRRAAEGVAAMEKARKLDPENAEIETRWGFMLQCRGKADQALAAYDGALRIDPNLVMAHASRALLLFQRGQYRQAAEGFRRAAVLAPKSALIQFRHGIALTYVGRAQEALETFDRALGLGVPAAQVQFQRASVLNSLGRYDEALRAHDVAKAGFPEGPAAAQLALIQGTALVGLGRFEEALKALEGAPAEGQATTQVKVARIRALAGLRRFDEAKKDCDWCVLVFADNPYFHLLRLEVCASCDGSPAALEKLAEVKKKFPDNHEVRRRHAQLLRASGRPKEALEVIEESLRLSAECHGCAHTKTRCLTSLERYAEMKLWLEKWVERAPTCSSCRRDLATTIMMLGRFEDAEKTLAAGELPEDTLDYAHTMSWRLQGKFAEALEAAERGYGRFPSGYAGNMVRCLRAAGETDRARKIAAEHSKEEPLPDGRLNWAYLRAVAGDRVGAEGALAAYDRPWTGGNAFFRARIHGVLGQTDEVIVWLTKAVDLGFRRPSNAAPEPDFAKAAKHRKWRALERRMRLEVRELGK